MLKFNVKEVKVKLKGDAEVKTRYCARPVNAGNHLTAKDLEDEIVTMSTLTRGDIRNAMSCVAEVVERALRRGYSVDLGDLGTIKPVINSRYEERADKVSANSLKTPTIRFFPKKRMRDASKAIQVQVESMKTSGTGSSSPTPSPGGSGSGGSGTPPDPGA